jgi:hypothetical protein
MGKYYQNKVNILCHEGLDYDEVVTIKKNTYFDLISKKKNKRGNLIITLQCGAPGRYGICEKRVSVDEFKLLFNEMRCRNE